jgi:hypothetical protein
VERRPLEWRRKLALRDHPTAREGGRMMHFAAQAQLKSGEAERRSVERTFGKLLYRQRK